MPPEIFGPAQYPIIWLVLAGLAVFVAIGWPLLIWWRRRPKRTVTVAAEPVVEARPLLAAYVRASYLERIDQIVAGHQGGRLSDRGAHQQLSGAVRSFVSDVSGIPANRFTLADLERALATQPALAPVAQFVSELYAPSFAADATRAVADSVRDAREVVQQWN